jgi:ElaB/YqjD/DUF883 family membrane-anchored ribosome-binding protein
MTLTTKTLTDGAAVGGKFANAVNQATAGVHDAIDSASGTARPAVEHMAASAHHAVDHLAGAVGHVADTLGTRGGQLMAAQSRLGENVRSQVRGQPMTYLGAAVATGMLLGWLMQRR